jgi:hypothetical protein
MADRACARALAEITVRFAVQISERLTGSVAKLTMPAAAAFTALKRHYYFLFRRPGAAYRNHGWQ